MVDFDRLKALGNEYLHKAGDLAEQAKEKAGPLVAEAREKAGPLAEKAKDAAAKGVDKAAERIDSATGGKYSDKIHPVTDKLSGALAKDAPSAAAGGAAGEAASNLRPATDVPSNLSTNAPAPDAAMSSGITQPGNTFGSDVTGAASTMPATGGDFATSRDVLGTTSDYRTSGDDFASSDSADGEGVPTNLGTPSLDYAVDDAGVGDVHSAEQSAEVFGQHAAPTDVDSTVGTGPVGEHASNLIPPAPQDRSSTDAPAVDDPWDGNVRGS